MTVGPMTWIVVLALGALLCVGILILFPVLVAHSGKDELRCARCKHVNRKAAKFCARCGQSLSE